MLDLCLYSICFSRSALSVYRVAHPNSCSDAHIVYMYSLLYGIQIHDQETRSRVAETLPIYHRGWSMQSGGAASGQRQRTYPPERAEVRARAAAPYAVPALGLATCAF